MYQVSVYPSTRIAAFRRIVQRSATMYQVSVYPITPNLWRWEIRCGGALLRCGTAPTRVAAEMNVNDVVNTWGLVQGDTSLQMPS